MPVAVPVEAATDTRTAGGATAAGTAVPVAAAQARAGSSSHKHTIAVGALDPLGPSEGEPQGEFEWSDVEGEGEGDEAARRHRKEQPSRRHSRCACPLAPCSTEAGTLQQAGAPDPWPPCSDCEDGESRGGYVLCLERKPRIERDRRLNPTEWQLVSSER